MTTSQRVDVHHHILPREYVRAVGPDVIAVQGSSGRVPSWSLADALATLDAANVTTAITSVTAPGVATLASAAQAADVARACNEFAAAMVRDHPGRFGLFATLPLQDDDACLAEVDDAYDRLAADGVCLFSNYDGHYLGADRFRPLYAALDRRAAVVFVHPTSPVHRVDVGGLSPSTLEFPFDTTRTIASIVFGGIARDFPAIRWIFAHAGGAMPYLAGRMDMLMQNNPRLRETMPAGFGAVLERFHFDCALSADRAHFAALRALVSEDRLLFGSDYPFGPKGQVQQTVDGVAACLDGVAARHKVDAGNALRLFPRLAQGEGTGAKVDAVVDAAVDAAVDVAIDAAR